MYALLFFAVTTMWPSVTPAPAAASVGSGTCARELLTSAAGVVALEHPACAALCCVLGVEGIPDIRSRAAVSTSCGAAAAAMMNCPCAVTVAYAQS